MNEETCLDEEREDVRQYEEECDPLGANEHVRAAPQPPCNSSKEHVVCSNETTRRKNDKRILYDVKPLLGRVVVHRPSYSDTSGEGYDTTVRHGSLVEKVG